MSGGETAFPKVTAYERSEDFENYREVCSDGGLTKREWFAGLAMQAVLQLPLEGGGECDELMMDLPSKAAEVCVACADALLAELAKEPQP